MTGRRAEQEKGGNGGTVGLVDRRDRRLRTEREWKDMARPLAVDRGVTDRPKDRGTTVRTD